MVSLAILNFGLCIVVSTASSTGAGIFGTRIRAPGDFRSYVTEAQDASDHSIAAFEAYGPSSVTSDALEDMNVFKSLLLALSSGARLRTIVECYSGVEGMSEAGEEAIQGILRVQESIMKNEAVKARLETALRLLLASEVIGFADVDEKDEAMVSLMVAIEIARDSKARDEATRRRDDSSSGHALSSGRVLSSDCALSSGRLSVAGWEQEEDVRILRSMWQNTADAVVARISESTGFSSATAPKVSEGVTAKKMVEITAAFVKGFFGLEIHVDVDAFQADKGSFAFSVFDESEIVGRLYLKIDFSGTKSSVLYRDFPVVFGGKTVPSSVTLISLGRAPAEEPAEQLLQQAKLGGATPALVQTETLQAIRLGEMSSYIFTHFTTSIVEFLSARDPTPYYQPLSVRTGETRERAVFNPLTVSLFTKDLIELVSRDLQEAMAGLAVSDPPKQATRFEWYNFFRSLEEGALIPSTRLELGTSEAFRVAQVLDAPPEHAMRKNMQRYRAEGMMGEHICPDQNGHLRALSLALAAMVHQQHNFRVKVFELHKALAARNQEAFSATDLAQAVWGSEFFGAAGTLVPGPSFAKLRDFIIPRLRGGAYQSFGILLPQLNEHFEAGNVEGAIDYAPLVSELIPRV